MPKVYILLLPACQQSDSHACEERELCFAILRIKGRTRENIDKVKNSTIFSGSNRPAEVPR